jgi:hypothetical protein
MNFKLNPRNRALNTIEKRLFVVIPRAMTYECEYKFYKDRPVNEIEDTICEEEATSDSDVVEATETEEDALLEESDDRETVSELGYNFIQLEVT